MVPELGLKSMWPEAVKHPEFHLYMPDDWNADNLKHCDRSFFYGVLGTLMPEFVSKRVADVMDKRLA